MATNTKKKYRSAAEGSTIRIRQLDADIGLQTRTNRQSAASVARSHRRRTLRRSTVLAFIRRRIGALQNANRLGTARNYERLLNSFSAHLGGRDITFSALDERTIDDYNVYLTNRSIMRNSISFYMRILRAVYNHAAQQGLVRQRFPFRNVYTGIDRTRKRAVNESVIERAYALDLSLDPQTAFARDMFLFSYFTRGMAFVDISHLRKNDIRDGAIRYSRHKTGQPLHIHIEPCIEAIIDRNRDEKSPYLFPILTSDNPPEAFAQYRQALNNHNRRLKKLSRLLGLECNLSSYTSRHSWATAARDHDIPLSVISAGMGHTSEHTTRIYLSSLDDSVIDAANRKIISGIGIR